MGEQPETKLVRKIRALITAELPDVFVLKIHGSPYQSAGLPDLLLLFRGGTFWIEAKCQRPGESEQAARARVTPRQSEMHERLRRAGCPVTVALSAPEALSWLAGAIAARRDPAGYR